MTKGSRVDWLGTRLSKDFIERVEEGFVGSCPVCRGSVIEIAYGLPDGELMEAGQRGEVALGGCMVEPGLPTHKCRMCSARLRPAEDENSWEVADGDPFR